MKKELNKTIIFIGFMVVVIGLVISGIVEGLVINALFLTMNFISVYLAAVLATAFVFTENGILKNIGYALIAMVGAFGIAGVIYMSQLAIGVMVSSIGMVVMFVGAVIHFFMICLKFFGFVKVKEHNEVIEKGKDILDVLSYYKDMQNEKILTEEEFEDIKKKLLNDIGDKVSSMDDLKKWKKLLDQKIINEEEFSSIKAEIFCK